MTKQDRIAQLLAQGMTPSLVAAVVGVTPGYISQLRADPDFKMHVEALVTELAEEAEESESTNRHTERLFYTDKLAAGEHKVLDNILNTVQYMSGKEMISALDVIGKRRDAMEANALRTQSGLASPGGQQTTVRYVELTMPTICVPELLLSTNREILSIGDRSVAPMHTTKLNELLANSLNKPATGETYDENDYSAL